ncbi:MAG: DUF2721 domain-containing protein [Pseudomonadota bacterium]
MDPAPSDAASIALAVQMAIAPIFLLVGTGAILTVMTHRLGRVVDRARSLEDMLDTGETGTDRARHMNELSPLAKRMTLANRAIAFSCAAAILVCVMIALLFIGELFSMAVKGPIAGLFVLTMGLLISGLTNFMMEIFVASRSLRVRGELLTDERS